MVDLVPAPASGAPSSFAPPREVRNAPSAADLDRLFHAVEGRLTQGASPISLWLALADWSAHSVNAPFRAVDLALRTFASGLAVWPALFGAQTIDPAPNDHRFADPSWRRPPFSVWAQAFLALEACVDGAARGAPGIRTENERLVSFAMRQWLDTFSPSNVPWLNPEVIAATRARWGRNLLEGAGNFLADLQDIISGSPSSAGREGLQVGRDLAVTPGEVVYRNDLIELIRYAPQTPSVRPEPILIVPAWIMKYYILDLSPHNSLIRYLVQNGYTVFCMSWRNPGPEFRDKTLDDYRRDGFMAALDTVSTICPATRIHACGYCLGGTLLSVSAAALARDGDERLASVTLFCAQTDFTEAGELQLFTTEDQIGFLEDLIATQGYLDGRQMGGAFQLLRSRDLVWSRMMKNYWLGERDQPNDLMTWNEDATRLPYRMHSEYLQHFYRNNDLAEGRLKVDGRAISVSDIRAPMFVVSTETDHVAPWRSVYKIELLNPGDITFVLTSGGHNAGIVSEPGHPHRRYRISRRLAGEVYAGPDEWLASAEARDGSWWPAWAAWLDARSGPQDRKPPAAAANGQPTHDPAPGRYVYVR